MGADYTQLKNSHKYKTYPRNYLPDQFQNFGENS